MCRIIYDIYKYITTFFIYGCVVTSTLIQYLIDRRIRINEVHNQVKSLKQNNIVRTDIINIVRYRITMLVMISKW